MFELPTVPQSATWLDRFPEEICDRIADHVCGGDQTNDALQLALTSRKQTRSVWHSLISNSFRPRIFLDLIGTVCSDEAPLPDDELAAWAHAFAEYPVAVHASAAFEVAVLTSGSTALASQFFHQLNIIEASICADDTDFLTALCNSRSVQTLFLHVTRDTDLSEVFSKVASLPLKELYIKEDFRALDDLVPFAAACAMCAEAIDSLTSFTWKPGNGMTEVSRSYWDAVAILPTFTKIVLTAPPPDHLFATLSQFRDITVLDVDPRDAGRLGSAVVNYQSYSICTPVLLVAEHLMELKNCPRITSLTVHVDESAQDTLIELVSRLPLLEELHVSWGNSDDDVLIDLAPGVMLNIVTASPNLEWLTIEKGHVPLSEWEPILTHAGGKLRFLLVEHAVDRTELCVFLLKVLSLLPRVCTKIQTLRVSCEFRSGQYAEQEEVEAVLHAARRVQMIVPTLNRGRLEENMAFLLSPPQEDADEGDENDGEEEDEEDESKDE